MRLAFTTIAVLKHPYGHPDILSYEERIGPVFGDAENSDRARPWIGDDEIPTWEEAARRIELLNDEGPSPEAFDSHTSYDEFGRLTSAPKAARSSANEGASAE